MDVTEVPVAAIFSKGLKRALAQNGFVGTNGSQYELRGVIQGFGLGAIQNGLFSLTSKAWVEVRFELVDRAESEGARRELMVASPHLNPLPTERRTDSPKIFLLIFPDFPANRAASGFNLY